MRRQPSSHTTNNKLEARKQRKCILVRARNLGSKPSISPSRAANSTSPTCQGACICSVRMNRDRSGILAANLGSTFAGKAALLETRTPSYLPVRLAWRRLCGFPDLLRQLPAASCRLGVRREPGAQRKVWDGEGPGPASRCTRRTRTDCPRKGPRFTPRPCPGGLSRGERRRFRREQSRRRLEGSRQALRTGKGGRCGRPDRGARGNAH